MRFPVLLCVLTPLYCASAYSHHSTTAYDHTRTISLKGVVKEFQWTNPHSWIQLLVTDDQGVTTEWSVETGAPNLNVRHGWKKTDLKAGDKVTLVIYPMRDGSTHGTLANATLPDGRVLDGAADFIPKDLAKDAGATSPGNPQKPAGQPASPAMPPK
jgi:hypothetical protein